MIALPNLGVRGIGSIYYLAYATGKMEFEQAGALWATVAFTIVLSTLLHGLSAGPVMKAVTNDQGQLPKAG